MTTTDQQVRHAIKAIIAAACPTAKVYEWNVLSHRIDEWPGLFRITGGAHGWIIMRSSTENEWKNGVRVRPIWNYTLLGFYGFRSGKEGDNSDDEFAVILDSIAAGLAANPRLDLDSSEVERHELLQIIQNSTIECGEETLHIAHCKLKVRLCC